MRGWHNFMVVAGCGVWRDVEDPALRHVRMQRSNPCSRTHDRENGYALCDWRTRQRLEMNFEEIEDNIHLASKRFWTWKHTYLTLSTNLNGRPNSSSS
jgi:hypothetical protein